jgi:3-phosphoshikimate 1-carboxyvinyltransferase
MPDMITVNPARRLRGEIVVPGDKSISHRGVMFNALAKGNATVTNFLPGEDCLSTISCMRNFGIEIAVDTQARTVQVNGRGLRGLQEAPDVLNAGNSGTTTRLLAGILSGFPFLSIITGDASLRSRPMKRIIEPLRRMGAKFSARADGTLAPLVIKGGSLQGLRYELPVASAQLKSCLLLAGMYADSDTVLTGLIDSRDHTERMLRSMGANLEIWQDALVMHPTSWLQAVDVAVPGDISSAAFWLVAASAHPDADLTLRNVGVNPTRTGIIDALLEMGADITLSNEREEAGEPVADIRVRSGDLRGSGVSGAMIPRLVDEIPVLSVAALYAKGKSRVADAAELRIKETDRIATVAGEFDKLGAYVETLPDGLVIEGQSGKLNGAVVDSHGDHRLAMALAVAGLLLSPGSEPIRIANHTCADVSYPGFWEDLQKVSEL